ncbi:voltage-gated potassium channel [Pleurotus eryngii]|uniref:Voltage-gated potassium channel n=1 Tax=Pleurotus eryngii TaxID=5323 RepID=A0A9P5ZVL6_PLEER|nr:voltage-gated potassium channel [Pleurotus eryngii]
MVWPLVYSLALTRDKEQTVSREPETGRYAAEEGSPEEEVGVDEVDDEADGGSLRWYTRLCTFLKPSPIHPDLNDYLPNYRLTPILSGFVIPFAILLEIPGLTEHWYIRTVDDKIVESRMNPAILVIGMAISMGIGLLANICLVLRFLERRVKFMTISCIVLLTIHDIINITAVTVFGVQHRFDDGFTYGQAFWGIVCSTIASTFTNVTLIVDFVRTNDFANSGKFCFSSPANAQPISLGSGLTRKQRSLVIIVIVLMCYVALGALVHSYLLQLSFINALYFSVVTIETVGLGDITPKTTGARVFVCFYAAFGVLNVALAVGQTRDTVLEALEVAYRKRMRDVGARRRERQRQVRVHQRWLDAITWRLNKMEQPVWVNGEESSHRNKAMVWLRRMWESGVRSRGGRALLYYDSHRHGMHLNLEVLTGAQLESAALEAGVPLSTLLPPDFKPRRGLAGDNGEKNPKRAEGGSSDMPLTHTRIGRMVGMLGKFANAVYYSGRLAGDIPLELAPTPRITPLTSGGEARFESFKVEMEKEEEKAFYASLTVAWTLFLAFWIAGSAIFHATEGWPLGSTMYFCFMSFMTIGYGDFAPVTPAGRSIFVLWALMGIATMTILISIVSEAYTSRYKHALRSDPFAKAVEQYRAKGSRAAMRRSSRVEQPSPLELSGNEADAPVACTPATEKRDTLEPHKFSEHQEQTKAQLEALPAKILHHAQVFQEHVQYFAGNHNMHGLIVVKYLRRK